MREGALPANPDARQQFVDELFGWFTDVQPDGFAAEMSLRSGDRWVLDAHDGFPGPLQLRPEEFVELQQRLTAAGLPPDLYYPILDQREVVEASRSHSGSGVVRGVMFYSPLQWAARAATESQPLIVPSEDERARAFAAACNAFREALLLRMQQLREPGRPERSTEADELEDLFLPVQDLWVQSRGVDMDQQRRLGYRDPIAGWPTPPSAFQSIASALPALRRLHPDAFVWQVFSKRARAEQPIRRWDLSLWVPSIERSMFYQLINGVLFGPGHESKIDASATAPIWPIERDEFPDLIDSPTILENVEAHGGREFRERTGGDLGELRLYGGFHDERIAWVASYGRRYPRIGMRIWLDARSGEIIGHEEDPEAPSAPA